MDDSLCGFFEEPEFVGDDDLFSIFESLDGLTESFQVPLTPFEETAAAGGAQKSGSSGAHMESETEGTSRERKRRKVVSLEETTANVDGPQRVSYITVERNRRKQMNEHLSVLRSLMPCFYVKRGDQASIIGGVVDYISELQQVLHSLESKKQRKVYSEVLSPRPSQLSPRLNLLISPRTPQPSSPYKLQKAAGYLSPTVAAAQATIPLEPSPTSSTSSVDNNELVANSKSPVADVEVKFSGPNLVLKTVSSRIPGQALKIISALEELSLEILKANINTVDETMLNSFTIKTSVNLTSEYSNGTLL
ncbi:putative WRKY transcription factor 53-like [Hibiscus syriacus]|uniref:WRKY transcription factor 53-like n=1 Tax=Hibiscus syriacus TaxID=106335 RepID=A0A6A3BHT1_HIBSY|nr:putative WRKY transcription factor 53-like [Hibiscus syriacus]